MSTYVRPIAPPPPPGFPLAGAPPPGFPVAAAPPPAAALPPLHFGSSNAPPAPAKKEKKEKPKEKLPIEGSDWVRVTTNRGNVFYNHAQTRESVWTIPDDIKVQVEALERKEREDKDRAEREERDERDRAAAAAASKKRKAEDDEPVAAPAAVDDVEDEDDEPHSARDDEAEHERAELDLEIEGAADDAGASVPDDTASAAAPAAPSMSDEPPKKKQKKAKVVSSLEDLADEDWQRSIAAQMAEEAAAEEQMQGEAQAVEKDEPVSEEARVQAQRLEVNAVEAAAMFKVRPLLPPATLSTLADGDSVRAGLAEREGHQRDGAVRDRARQVRQRPSVPRCVRLSPAPCSSPPPP